MANALIAVVAMSLLNGMAEEPTKVPDQPRPADPAFEKWLPLLNA